MSDVVLVTGGAGFIGTWVLRALLERGTKAVALDVAQAPDRWRKILGPGAAAVPFVTGSLLDRDGLRRACDEHRVTHFIHLAALLTPACQRDPWAGCEVNVLGGVALFEEARRAGAQVRGLSYASSLGIFGPEPDDGAPGAEPGNRPPNFYGAFKKAFELIAEQYWRHFRIPSLGVRPHVVYGPEREQGLTAGPSLAVRAAVRGEPFAINYVGRAGYDYVEDVARAFVRGALETPPGADVVDLPNELTPAEEIAAAIREVVPGARVTAAGPPLPLNVPPRPRPVTAVFPDWQVTPLVDGLRKTADFYRGG